MTSSKRHEIEMTNGPLFGKVLLFTIPLMLSAILQLVFNAADMVVAGRFSPNGSRSIGAIGATLALINLVIALVNGCSVGTNVVVAEYIGAKRDRQISSSVHTSVTFGLVMGVLFGILGIVLSGPVLTAMGTPEGMLPLSLLYVRIYFAGLPLLSLYNFGSAILRAVGDTRRPMVYLLISGVINVILNMIFVIGLNMDVAGVACATVISEGVSAFLVLRSLFISDAAYRLTFSGLSLNGIMVKRIIHIGIPAGLQSALFSLSNILIQSTVNSFGETVIAGNSAANSLGNFVGCASQATTHAATTFTSQNYGAGKYRRIDKVLSHAMVVGIGLTLLMGGSFTLFSHTLLGIYTKDPAAIDAGAIRMLYLCLPFFLDTAMCVFVGVLRGIGYEIIPMVSTLVGACAFRILWIYTVFAAHPTLHTLYVAYPVTWTLTTLFEFAMYLYIRKKTLVPKMADQGT